MYSSMWRGSGNGGGGSVDYSRVVEKIAVIPSVETATVGKVYMYIGESNATYTHGYIYECVATQTASDVAFSGSIITSWPVADFVAYLQEGGSAYNEVTHGTLTYDASGGLWDLVGYDANGIKVLSFHEYTEDLADFGCVFASSTHQDGDNCTFTMTTTESGKKWKRLDVQPAGGSGDVASVNGKTGVVVLDAQDVGALADSTKYAASASWTINSSTYVMTLQLKDQDNNNLGQAQTIDLPLESVVVNGSYDSTNKKIVLTLQNGNTIEIPVADLVNGLQTEITAQNKLDADLVDDSTGTNKFVTASDKTTWSGKQDALVSGTNIKTIDGNSVLGSGNLELSTYLTYPAGWTTNSTTKAFCDDVAADTSAVKGKAYLGEVTISDLPASLGNGEIIVEIMDGTTAQNKVIVLTLTSGNTAPYMWKYTYWNGGTNVSGWQTWATAAQGAKADTAVQPADLATVATTGAYSDLIGTPTIPVVNNATLTITQGGVTKGTFTANAGTDVTIDVDAGGGSGLPSQTGNAGKFLTTDGTDASWATVDALPSQSGNNGKFLTTNGSAASWASINALQNTATGSNSLSILGNSTAQNDSINIGNSSEVAGNGVERSVAIGVSSWTTKARTTTLGYNATSMGYGGIAVGYQAAAHGDYSIQLGSGTNSNANTMKVRNSNGNFELMSADGTIPEARLADTTNAAQGMVLTLDSNLNAVWQAGGSGGVSDVTVNGTSVVSGGVAAITCATIDDTSTSSSTATWSASKLNTTIGNIESLLAAI